MTRGNKPRERKEIESVIARIDESVISYFFASSGRAGAIKALAKDITKV